VGRIGAGQGDEAGFRLAIERALSAGPVWFLAAQTSFQALLDETLAQALDPGVVDLERFGVKSIGPGRAGGGGVRFTKDAGVDPFLGSHLAGGDQSLQRVTFLGCQRDHILFHGGILLVPPQHILAAALGKSKVLLY